MNKQTIIFVALAAILVGYFFMSRSEQTPECSTQATEIPALPTPPAAQEATTDAQADKSADVVAATDETQKSPEPEMTEEEFQELITQLMKKAADEEAAKKGASAATA